MARLINRALYSCDLPPHIEKMCELIGWAAAMSMVDRWGGTYIVFARKVREHRTNANTNPELVLLIGEESYEKLIDQFGGQKIYIPKLDHAMRKARDMQINQKYVDEKQTAEKLALDYRLSERQIWNILNNPDTLRTDQPDLFD